MLVALWINYKRKAFADAGVDFVIDIEVFFEVQADFGASLMMILCMLAVRRGGDIFHQWNKKYMFLNFMAGFLGVFCTQIMFGAKIHRALDAAEPDICDYSRSDLWVRNWRENQDYRTLHLDSRDDRTDICQEPVCGDDL